MQKRFSRISIRASALLITWPTIFGCGPGLFSDSCSASGSCFDPEACEVRGQTEYTIEALAGVVNSAGLTDGSPLSNVQFNGPAGLVVDSSGGLLVADMMNHNIRRLTLNSNSVQTMAGSGSSGYAGDGGNATAALLSFAEGVHADSSGNIYIADRNNHRVRKVSPDGQIFTLAGSGNPGSTDGIASGAEFDLPADLALQGDDTLYVVARNSHCLRRITLSTGNVTTVAGDCGEADDASGDGASARFNGPSGVAVDEERNVYVSDTLNHRIKKFTPTGGVQLVAGDGISGIRDGAGESARFDHPGPIDADPCGFLYVGDVNGNRVRQISPEGAVRTIAGNGNLGVSGNGGDALNAELSASGIAFDRASGRIYVSDANSHVIRVLIPR